MSNRYEEAKNILSNEFNSYGFEMVIKSPVNEEKGINRDLQIHYNGKRIASIYVGEDKYNMSLDDSKMFACSKHKSEYEKKASGRMRINFITLYEAISEIKYTFAKAYIGQNLIKYNDEFHTIWDVSEVFNKGYKPGMRIAFFSVGDKDLNEFAWCPQLEECNSGENPYRNEITYDEAMIFESKKDNDLDFVEEVTDKPQRRYVFPHCVAPSGNVAYVFKGIYELNIEKTKKQKRRVWERKDCTGSFTLLSSDILKSKKTAQEIEEELDAENLKGETREVVVKQRVNQGVFRDLLLYRYNNCCLCGVSNPNVLIASHIKPWVKSNGNEKLDADNGFLLCPNHDKLFDKGYISFDDDGSIMISDSISDLDKQFMNVFSDMKVELTEGNKKYLKYHREHIFKS